MKFRIIRTGLSVTAFFGLAALVSGCVGGPTYGTDKTATEQLFSDLGNIASLPKSKKEIDYKPRPEIVQPPKSEAATLPPPQTSVASAENPNWYETPEETRERLVAEATANQNNPGYRSPIQVRNPGKVYAQERIPAGTSPRKLDASPDVPFGMGVKKRVANNGPKLKKTPGISSPRERDASPNALADGYTPSTGGGYSRNDSFREKLRIQGGRYSDRRRYLSDPPLAYRQPAETAPTDDLGVAERKKEKMREKAAAKPGTGSPLRRLWPF